MADNFEANAGSGGKTFASDEIGGVDYPRCKLSLGADGTANDASAGAGAVGTGVQRVTLASDDPAVTDLAAIEVLNTTIAGDTTSIDGKITACNTGAVTVSAALPAGTNAIGKLAANSGVDIGDVDILSIAAGDNNIGNVDIASALPAGTNAIGKLAANSGVDIGDVDVTSIANGSLNGPAAPTIDSYANIAINLTTGANQQLVAAPGASKQIWVYGVGFSCSADGTGVSFQDEDDTAVTGVMTFAQYGGLNSSPAGNFAMPMWKVTTNKAFEVDITTGDVDGWLAYAVVSV